MPRFLRAPEQTFEICARPAVSRVLTSCPCLRRPEADDLAQYLDHLLAHATPKKPQRPAGGGLGRFKALASKTKEMVALKNIAQGLDVHGE